MRLLSLLLALIVLVLGIVFGALNPEAARVDLYWAAVETRVGPALLVAALVGALLGGFAVLVGVAWPLSRRLRRARGGQALEQRDALAPDEAA